jgi:hypothetical protein
MTYEAGRKARLEGKTASDNPYVIGITKLGNPKLSEAGVEWDRGFNSIGRVAGKAEVDAARTVEVSRFRRKPNRYYGGNA